ncbi:MAG: hypothetical protein ACTFAK_00620 [Candidatus Electronema sp. VV]
MLAFQLLPCSALNAASLLTASAAALVSLRRSPDGWPSAGADSA